VPADLAARGHDVTLVEPWSSSMGHAHALEVVTDEDGGRTFAAAADPRCEGSAEAW
jgi:gamma-glutamyltranspeptidase